MPQHGEPAGSGRGLEVWPLLVPAASGLRLEVWVTAALRRSLSGLRRRGRSHLSCSEPPRGGVAHAPLESEMHPGNFQEVLDGFRMRGKGETFPG